MKTEKQLLGDAFRQLGAQVISDLGRMPKRLKKQMHKDRIKAFQNNQFNKSKK
jgi:hypothetical protein